MAMEMQLRSAKLELVDILLAEVLPRHLVSMVHDPAKLELASEPQQESIVGTGDEVAIVVSDDGVAPLEAGTRIRIGDHP